MTLNAGFRLGPYEIVSLLGAGGMGEVYKARDTRLDREVAVKVLLSGDTTSDEMRQRFEREAKAISQLSHPHICSLYDVGSHEGTAYLVMEYLEGETLATRIAKGPLQLDRLLPIGIQIAEALDRAHRQGIVHRDLKPGNVMLTKSGVKLLDFGLARTLAPQAGPSGMTSLPTMAQPTPLTQKGTILGTFQYMAPEQLEGGEADARSDIFAFGSVLYEMATGRKAFEGKSQTSVIGSILKDEPPAVSSLAPMTPLTLCTAPEGKGGTWSPAGVIVFAASPTAGLFRVSDKGGEAAPVTKLDVRRGDDSHRHPRFLPDGKHYLYVARNQRAAGEGNPVIVASIDGGAEKVLLRSPAAAIYASGHLLYLREATLMARPFDTGSLSFTGDAAPVAEGILMPAPATAVGVFSASQNGILVYQTARGQLASALQWYTRDGKPDGTLGEPADYGEVVLSPDGKQAAVTILDAATGTHDVWVFDLGRGVRTRFTFDPADDLAPVWSPDSAALVFSSNRKGHYDLYRKSLDGSAEEEALLVSEHDEYVYVTSFPGAGRKWQVSAGGGAYAYWSADGREIIYHDLGGMLHAVAVTARGEALSIKISGGGCDAASCLDRPLSRSLPFFRPGARRPGGHGSGVPPPPREARLRIARRGPSGASRRGAPNRAVRRRVGLLGRHLRRSRYTTRCPGDSSQARGAP